MALTANDISTMDGLFKETFADKLERLLPDGVHLGKDIPFVSKEKREGASYNQPVHLSRCQGFTLAASGDGAFTLNDGEAAISKEATINGAQCVLREAIAYEAMARAGDTNKPDKRAFVQAFAHVVENMVETLAYVREMELLYGGGTGTASEGIGIINSRTDDSGTSQTFDLTLASWADAIWAGAENMFCDVYDTTMATKRNTSGTMQITAVDLDNRKLTFLGTEAEMDNIVATDKIVFRGAKGKEMIGLQTIAANTGSIFGISAATYGMWKAASYPSSGSLSFTKVLRGLRKAAARGLGSEGCLYVSIPTWTDVMNDLSALRRYMGDKKNGDGRGTLYQGAGALIFEGPSGITKIKGHPLLKGGIAIGMAPRYAERVGSTDITFQLPGMKEDHFFRNLDDKAGVELRGFWQQALFIRRPATLTYFTGIVNST